MSDPGAIATSQSMRSRRHNMGTVSFCQISSRGSRFALCDDNVGALIEYLARLLQALHLADSDNACGADLAREWPGIAKGQHNGQWCVADRLIEGFGPARQPPGDKTAPHSDVACRRELALQHLRIAVGAPDHPQPASAAD